VRITVLYYLCRASLLSLDFRARAADKPDAEHA